MIKFLSIIILIFLLSSNAFAERNTGNNCELISSFVDDNNITKEEFLKTFDGVVFNKENYIFGVTSQYQRFPELDNTYLISNGKIFKTLTGSRSLGNQYGFYNDTIFYTASETNTNSVGEYDKSINYYFINGTTYYGNHILNNYIEPEIEFSENSYWLGYYKKNKGYVLNYNGKETDTYSRLGNMWYNYNDQSVYYEAKNKLDYYWSVYKNGILIQKNVFLFQPNNEKISIGYIENNKRKYKYITFSGGELLKPLYNEEGVLLENQYAIKLYKKEKVENEIKEYLANIGISDYIKADYFNNNINLLIKEGISINHYICYKDTAYKLSDKEVVLLESIISKIEKLEIDKGLNISVIINKLEERLLGLEKESKLYAYINYILNIINPDRIFDGILNILK